MSLEPSAFMRRAVWAFASAGLLCVLGGTRRACGSEFEITADSFTVDKQVNLSSVTYYQGQTTAPGSPGAATKLANPGGLYFDGTYYDVWNSQTGAWVQVATGTVETGRVARTGDTMTGQLTLAGSTLTVAGNAFSVGGSTLVVSGGSVGIGTTNPGVPLDVWDSGGNGIRSMRGGAGADMRIIGDGATGGLVGTWSLHPLLFMMNGSEHARIDSSGNMGIGTTGPTQGKLVVQGVQNSLPTMFANDAGGNGQTGAVVDLEGNMASNPSLNRSLLLLRDTNPAGSDVGDSLLMRAFGTTAGGGGGTATTVFTVSREGTIGVYGNICNVGGGNCLKIDNANDLMPNTVNGIQLGTSGAPFSALYVGNGIYLNGVAYTNPDYVFEPGYKLMPLDKLETFTDTNKHLPHVPSTREVKKKGVEIFEQNRVVLENLEAAYRYIFQLNAKFKEQQAEIDALRAELKKEKP